MCCPMCALVVFRLAVITSVWTILYHLLVVYIFS